VLKPCPRCTGPSRIVPKENKGLCSRIGCQFHFCTLCNCLYHLRETPCRLVRGCKIKTIISPLNSPQKSGLNNSTLNSKAARVSSKQSKKRLKRLWQQTQNHVFMTYTYIIRDRFALFPLFLTHPLAQAPSWRFFLKNRQQVLTYFWPLIPLICCVGSLGGKFMCTLANTLNLLSFNSQYFR
jgi:hypothetical protein